MTAAKSSPRIRTRATTTPEPVASDALPGLPPSLVETILGGTGATSFNRKHEHNAADLLVYALGISSSMDIDNGILIVANELDIAVEALRGGEDSGGLHDEIVHSALDSMVDRLRVLAEQAERVRAHQWGRIRELEAGGQR